MNYKIPFLIVFSIILASCGVAKKGSDASASSSLAAKKVIKNYDNSVPEFNTLNARLNGTFDDGHGEQNVTLNMRIHEGDTIWINASKFGISLARMMITQDRVQFYEKLSRRYFDGDFALLSHWLGMEVNYDKVQNLLLGRATESLSARDFTMDVLSSGYLFSLKDKSRLEQSFLIDKKRFRLKGHQMRREAENESVTIEYPEYREKSRFIYPKNINIVANQKKEYTKVQIDYKSIEVDKEVSFPFNMPSGYKEIRL